MKCSDSHCIFSSKSVSMVVVSRLQQLFDYFKVNKQQWNGDVSALDQIRIMWGDNLQAQSSAVVCSDVFMWMKLFVGRRWVPSETNFLIIILWDSALTNIKTTLLHFEEGQSELCF